METERINPDEIRKVTEFHGHWCPGLAIGIRASEWALAEMGKSPDEEIVAVVETDMCGVDAIQYLTGCTFGKGNLIHRDYGKNAFTFYRRSDGKSARLVFKTSVYGDSGRIMSRLHQKMKNSSLSPEEENQLKKARQDVSSRIMESEPVELFEIKEAMGPAPKKARIFNSLTCESCGEGVMETRTRRFNDQLLCVPCFEELQGR